MTIFRRIAPHLLAIAAWPDGANDLRTFFINGPGAAPYQITDIPHGTLNIDWCPSPALKLTRRVYVYTPADYRSGTTRYPVLCLLHGGGGDEEAWTTGNADQAAAQNLVPRLFQPATRDGDVHVVDDQRRQ
jgi:enterochelin esterase-like enzyme